MKKRRITFIGEDSWSAYLAEGLNCRFADRIQCRALRIRDSSVTLPQIVAGLIGAETIVRVGFPPIVTSHEEYDEIRYAHRTGYREQLKRHLFKTTFGKRLREWVLFSRSEPAWRRRVLADWLQQHGRRHSRRRKDFLYWIGSDVQTTIDRHRDNTTPPKYLTQITNMENIAGQRRLAEELVEAGIKARTVPFPGGLARPPEHLVPMPQEMTVVTYIPDIRRDFYGWNEISAAAEQLPEIRFIVMGGSSEGLTSVPPNVEFLGFIEDPRPLFDACSVVIRHVQHDGGGGAR